MAVRVLSRAVVQQSLSMPEVVAAVKNVYCLKAQGKTAIWPLVFHEFKAEGGLMDIRSGLVQDIQLHGLKMLNNFPPNAQRGLAPFNGLMLVFDSNTGIPLGVLDASYVTCMRTGAAGAVGAWALARKDSKTLLMVGAGKQALYLIAATLLLMPGLEQVYVSDPVNPDNARRFAADARARLEEELGVDSRHIVFEAAEGLETCVPKADIIITATPSRAPLIQKEWVRPGTHFSCLGSDCEGKEELDPRIFKDAVIFTDDLSQCIRVGEIEIPLQKQIITAADVRGEIGQLLTGMKTGRENAQQITIFDATGLFPLDIVTAKIAFDYCEKNDLGAVLDL